jgi:hypothetical protein
MRCLSGAVSVLAQGFQGVSAATPTSRWHKTIHSAQSKKPWPQTHPSKLASATKSALNCRDGGRSARQLCEGKANIDRLQFIDLNL